MFIFLKLSNYKYTIIFGKKLYFCFFYSGLSIRINFTSQSQVGVWVQIVIVSQYIKPWAVIGTGRGKGPLKLKIIIKGLSYHRPEMV